MFTWPVIFMVITSPRRPISNLYLLPLVGATFDRLSNIMEAFAEREKNVVHPHTLGAHLVHQTECLLIECHMALCMVITYVHSPFVSTSMNHFFAKTERPLGLDIYMHTECDYQGSTCIAFLGHIIFSLTFAY